MIDNAYDALNAHMTERMKAAHEAGYTDWLRDKVGASRAALEEGTNQVIPAKEWAAKRAKKAKANDQLLQRANGE